MKSIAIKRLILFGLIAMLTILGWTLFSPSTTQAQEFQPYYVLTRPFAPPAQMKPQYGFLYGAQRSAQTSIHHGVDILNRVNTPVLAAADGVVYYAGQDDKQAFGASTNFYGNLIIIQHNIKAPDGRPFFTLYGHLSKVDVKAGQPVAQGQPIGGVGMAGIAVWYHLHLEVRVGDPNDYNSVRNPELYYAPLPGTARVIGRLIDSQGGLAMGQRIILATANGVLPSNSYMNGTTPAEPAFNENFVMPDLLPGCYQIRVKNGRGGLAVDQQVCVKANETKWLVVQMK